MSLPARKPDWLRVRFPNGEGQERFRDLKEQLRGLDLNTVCEEARCPNIFECWAAGTATIMILGETCTRGCRFCSVNTGDPGGFADPREPENVGRALGKMDLAYVVMTMVDRDDLLDGGADHVARTVQRIRHYAPELLVEVLLGDFQGVRKDVETVVIDGAPDVFAHNVEVVPRLQRTIRDARCSWERSVDVLRWAKDAGVVTKSSLMVGLGETEDEMLEAMASLRDAGVDVLTIGQYLRPTKKHAEVKRYVEPAEFEKYREEGEAMGFRFVASGPLVRSSYRAAEAFLHGVLKGKPRASVTPTDDVDRYGRKRRLHVLGDAGE
ncbi:MAG: lipoyl synthase [Sandaracinus sp.]|nr:lipoyl synthase [Sandaracinus sp.]